MQKIALYNGTRMSLLLLEEKLASLSGLHVWQCSCGSKFMTVYYASFHCEKHHTGEKFMDKMNLKTNLLTDTKHWNAFYSSVSDVIFKTIVAEATVPSDPQPDRNQQPANSIIEEKPLKMCDCSKSDTMEKKPEKISHMDSETNTEEPQSIKKTYADCGANTEQAQTTSMQTNTEEPQALEKADICTNTELPQTTSTGTNTDVPETLPFGWSIKTPMLVDSHIAEQVKVEELEDGEIIEDEEIVKPKRRKIIFDLPSDLPDDVRPKKSRQETSSHTSKKASSKETKLRENDRKLKVSTPSARIIYKSPVKTTVTNKKSGIRDYSNYAIKPKTGEGQTGDLLFAPKVPKKSSVQASSDVAVSRSTHLQGIKTELKTVVSVMPDDSEPAASTAVPKPQSQSLELQKRTKKKKSQEITGKFQPGTAITEPGSSSSKREHSRSSRNKVNKGNTSFECQIAEQLCKIAQQNTNFYNHESPQASSSQEVSLAEAAFVPWTDEVPQSGIRHTPAEPMMIMSPELQFPIPDPASYPYPNFCYVHDRSRLVNPDETPTRFLWLERANFYYEVQEFNLDPFVARELWMKKHVPNDRANYR